MKKLPILLLTVAFIASCSKDEAPPKTKTQLLTQGTWRFSAATVGGSDVSAFLQTCQKDNTMTFAAAGTGNVDEGATKCNAPDPQSNPFTWSWQSSETVLQVSAIFFTGGSNNFSLVALTETQLVLSQVITVSGTPQNAVVTFIH
ncbi:MAG: lipocalin family protein [Bacteroidota bacterium]